MCLRDGWPHYRSLYFLCVAFHWMGQDDSVLGPEIEEFIFKVVYLLAMLFSVHAIPYIYKTLAKAKPDA